MSRSRAGRVNVRCASLSSVDFAVAGGEEARTSEMIFCTVALGSERSLSPLNSLSDMVDGVDGVGVIDRVFERCFAEEEGWTCWKDTFSCKAVTSKGRDESLVEVLEHLKSTEHHVTYVLAISVP